MLKMRRIFFLSGLLFLVSCWQVNNARSADSVAHAIVRLGILRENPRPNIIYILADDLGYGDLSCYGQTKFQTPNIDRLGENGIRFTNHYAGSTVCAPSRSSLITGLHTGHTPIRGNQEIRPEGQIPLPSDAPNFVRSLKNAGYTTGIFGKWGLGYPGSEGEPQQQGFDQFFGYNCQRLAHHYYPEYLWENNQHYIIKANEGTKKGVYAPHLIHNKTLEFIEQNQDNPFFLFISSVIPHAELTAPEKDLIKYSGKFPHETPFIGIDEGPKFKKGGYGSQSEPRAAFASMVGILDKQVGEVVSKLETLGIAENTIIFFSSDNGPHREGGADPEYFDSNGPLKGFKRDLYEGGIRVPLLVSWPGTIKQGMISGHLSSFWDIFPTLAEIVDFDTPEGLDGISFLPTLIGDVPAQKTHEYLYWEFAKQGGKQAIRKGDWKALRLNINSDTLPLIELYNLKQDPSEEKNLAKEYPEMINQFEKLFRDAHTPSEQFPLFEIEK